MEPRSIAHWRLPTRAFASEVFPSNTYRSEKSAWQTFRHRSFCNKLQQRRARKKLCSARRGCTDEFRKSQTQVPTSIVREHGCALLQHTAMVRPFRSHDRSFNHKMEASRLLQCSSVCILMFAAQLMWLDMREDRTPLQSTVFSAHVIEHVVRSTYTLKSAITFVIQCLKIHASCNGLIFVWYSCNICVHLERILEALPRYTPYLGVCTIDLQTTGYESDTGNSATSAITRVRKLILQWWISRREMGTEKQKYQRDDNNDFTATERHSFSGQGQQQRLPTSTSNSVNCGPAVEQVNASWQ